MNYMEIRSEDLKKVHLSEIHTVIIDSTAVSMTSALLCELMHRKVKVIFCDEKRNPHSELIPYYGSHDTSACIRQQISWRQQTKEAVWTEIVTEKIRRQQELLLARNETRRAEILGSYLSNTLDSDIINLEGHAAKTYFPGLFGEDFTRSQECATNAALNYGYSILLSAFNKEVAAAGYMTQIGMFHDNMFNPFNLSSDLMEPFRPLVDEIVLNLNPAELTKEVKYELTSVLNTQVEIDGQTQFTANAIRIYTRSVLNALNENNTGEIKFYHPIRERKAARQSTEKQKGSALMAKLNEILKSEG